MMKDFNWNEFKEGKIAVHCPKKYLAEHFLSKCIENGVNEWRAGNNITINNTYWDRYETNIAYSNWFGFGFGTKEFYIKKGCKIIEWQLNPTSKEDVEEIAKFMSREEFIEDIYLRCPSRFGLKKPNMISVNCKYCREESLKDIKFKGDKEEPTKQPIEELKTYSIVEAVKDFEEGTLFKGHDGLNYKLKNNNLFVECPIDGWRETINSIFTIANMKFTLVEEPKKSYKLYKVEHSLGGTLYTFRSDELLMPDTWVNCDTRMGKAYGFVKGWSTKELTKAEYEKYKKIVRV